MPAFEMDESIPVRWNRQQWLCVFSSHSPTIRKVTEYLGLGLSASSSNTNRGIPKFDVPEYRRLSSEVSRLSKDLPKDRDALLDVATDGQSLERELDELLEDLGPKIWGRDADRSRLLAADPANKTYPKDLVYEDPEDREIIKTHVHRWIVIKACYYIRNQKLKRYSAPGESELLGDVDAPETAISPTKPQLLSPNATPQTGTPAPESSSTGLPEAAQPANDRKRKSDAYLVDSDVERYPRATDSPPPAKRPYSSATVPILRKSPRKSISTGRLSTENIPPMSDLASHRHASAGSSEGARHLISPVSSNALNDAIKSESGPPKPEDGVPKSSSISSGGFTAVNAGPAQQHHHHHHHHAPPPKGYTSPYAVPPHTRTPPNVPPGVAILPSHPPQAAPPSAPNGVGSQPIQPTPAPQTASHVPNGTPVQPIQPAHAPQTAPNMPNGTGMQYVHHPQGGASAHNSPGTQHAPHPHAALAPRPQPQPQPQSHLQSQPQSHNPSLPQHQPQAQPPQHQPQTQPEADAQPSMEYLNSRSVLRTYRSDPIICPNCSQSFTTDSNLQRHIRQMRCQGPPASGPHMQYAPQTYNSPNFSPKPQIQEIAPAVPRKEELDMLQCELLRDLMQFFFPPKHDRVDETALLHKLELLWRDNAPAFRQQMGVLYEAQNKVLYAWIEERRKIGQLQRSLEGRPGVVHMEMIDRLLAMNDLRVMRLKWKGMKTHDGVTTISSEELLCRTFATMTKTEGTEHLFQNGLEKLNESIFSFLQSEDMKISLSKR